MPHINKGFTLLEMLLVLLIISCLTVLSVMKIPTLSINMFEEEYYVHQTKALALAQTQVYNHDFSSNVGSLSFNALGHVNQAQTIMVNNHKFTVQLGMGRLFYE